MMNPTGPDSVGTTSWVAPGLALVGCALLAALLLGAAPAGANARSTISYVCRGGDPPIVASDNLATDFAASAGCNVRGDSTFGTSDAVAQGLTTFGFPAAADAQTAIMVNGGNSTTARLTAVVRSNFWAAPLAQPPLGVTEIPIKITAPYTMSVSVNKEFFVGGGSGATVLLRVGLDSVFDQLHLGGSVASGGLSREGALVWTGVIGVPVSGLSVDIQATCQSEALHAVSTTISSDCQAVIDPFFEFDQAAFDALMGEDSFALADYFFFRLSENLGQPPGSLDLDRDGIENALDNCPYFLSADLADADGNGIGDPCECGDQSGDGWVNVNDLIAINLAIFNPPLVTPLCDTDNDGKCSVSDIVGANLKIFGEPAYCSRYPYPAP